MKNFKLEISGNKFFYIGSSKEKPNEKDVALATSGSAASMGMYPSDIKINFRPISSVWEVVVSLKKF